jgi:hypothetical protein
MSTRINSIVWVKDRDYEVSLDVEGVTRTCTCTVVEWGGLRIVQDRPAVLLTLSVDPRKVVAAVIGLDTVNHGVGAAPSDE